MCYWTDGLNWLCMDHQVDVKAGWEYIQSYAVYPSTTTYYWKLQLRVYHESAFTFHPNLMIEKLYTNEITIDWSSFKSYVYP